MRSKATIVGAGAALALGALLFAALRGSPQRVPPPALQSALPPVPLVDDAERAGFVGSAACAACHPQQATAHERTLHARTLGRVGAEDVDYFHTSQRLRDKAIPAEYGVGVRDGKPVVRVKENGAPAKEIHPEWRVGSGKHASAFLAQQEEGLMELRVSYYPPVKEWRWTAAQEEELPGRPAAGRALAGERARQCFLCHSTAVVVNKDQPDPARSVPNIGCERCHGPGRAHVESVSAGKGTGGIYSLKNLRGADVMKLCGECHRSPSESPGAPAPAASGVARFAATALGLSACYRRSQGALSCISCHNPHSRLSQDSASYERVCLSCHGGSGAKTQTRCPVNPRTNCVNCHMPKEPVAFPLTLYFHNHWIRRPRG